MYQEINDEEIFKKFWLDEKEHTPRFFNDSSNAWHVTYDDFLGFCRQSWKVFLLDDIALIYIEKLGPTANIHFSLLRGGDAQSLIPDFIAIRNEIFRDVELIFGWVGSRNRGLRKIIEAVGFKYYGFTMIKGQSHGKLLNWQCFSIARNERFVSQTEKSVLISI